jgi:hypothetical protein
VTGSPASQTDLVPGRFFSARLAASGDRLGCRAFGSAVWSGVFAPHGRAWTGTGGRVMSSRVSWPLRRLCRATRSEVRRDLGTGKHQFKRSSCRPVALGAAVIRLAATRGAGQALPPTPHRSGLNAVQCWAIGQCRVARKGAGGSAGRQEMVDRCCAELCGWRRDSRAAATALPADISPSARHGRRYDDLGV